MRFLVVITCADIYNEYPTLGCAGCDKTTIIEGMQVALKIKNPPYVGINKVMSTKYFVESTWYLYA